MVVELTSGQGIWADRPSRAKNHRIFSQIHLTYPAIAVLLHITQTCTFAQYTAAPFGSCGGTRASLGNSATRISKVVP